MNVTIVLEDRYRVTPDGSVWSQGGLVRRFWERYLEVFDTVRIVARCAHAEQAPAGWPQVVTGNDILLHGLPDFLGPWQCLMRYQAIRAAILSATPAGGAVILRVGSQIANMMERPLQERNHPFALEVVGDPYEVFAPGVVDHPLRPFFRWHFSRHLRLQCLRANGVAYVTKRALQERYPTPALNMSISDVNLPPEAFLGQTVSTPSENLESELALAASIRTSKQHGPFRLVTVGSLAQPYKGTDVLIEAVASCVRAGMDVTAAIVGDGKYRTNLTAQAERAGIESRIQFHGQVTPGEPVRRILDTADLFVLPSRTEGLPRALIEAMARGLPCIASAVGGIPELLEPTELVPPGDSAVLATRIQEVLGNQLRMETMSRRNLAVAREYRASVLAERRRRFYQHVRDATQDWELRQKVDPETAAARK